MPILIFINKSDIGRTISDEVIIEKFKLERVKNYKL